MTIDSGPIPVVVPDPAPMAPPHNDIDEPTNVVPDDNSPAPVPPVPAVGVEARRSTRLKTQPSWMQEYICSSKPHTSSSNSCQYPMSNYMSNSSLPGTYQAFLTKLTFLKDPQSYAEVVLDPKWILAMNKELQAFQDNNTWSLTDLPPHKVPIRCKWVYKIKYKANGDVDRYKPNW